jgi:hypothetical protein
MKYKKKKSAATGQKSVRNKITLELFPNKAEIGI